MVPFHNLVAMAGQRRVSRAALPALFLAALTVSAYYVYHHSVQLKDWLSDRPSDYGVSAVVDSERAPLAATPAKIGVAPSAPTTELGSATNATVAVMAPTPAADSTTEIAAAPVMRGSIRASVPDAINGEARTAEPSLSASTAAPQISENRQAMAVQAHAVKTEPVANVTDTAAASYPQSRYRAPSSVGPQGRKQARSTRWVEAYPTSSGAAGRRQDRAIRFNIPPDSARLNTCTEAVAALGLCN